MKAHSHKNTHDKLINELELITNPKYKCSIKTTKVVTFSATLNLPQSFQLQRIKSAMKLNRGHQNNTPVSKSIIFCVSSGSNFITSNLTSTSTPTKRVL